MYFRDFERRLEVTEIPIRDIAYDTTFDFDFSNLPCKRRGDKFVPRENNWQQLGYVRAAVLHLSFSPFILPSHSRLSPSLRRCILISHPSYSFRIPVCYGPEDFVNASMHMYFIASSFGRSLFGSTRATITENARQGYFCRIDSFWKYLKLGRFVVCARVELDKTPVSIASHSTDLGNGARLKDSRGSAIDADARIVEKVKGRKRGSKGKRERDCGGRKDRVRGTKIKRARAKRIKVGGTVMAENLIT